MSFYDSLETKTDKCAIKKCTWKSEQPNNENALDLITQGGYGDFYDYFDERPVYFRLCHKHAHQFADWINDDEILPRRNHYHSNKEKGYWVGHVGGNSSLVAYITSFFYYLRKDNLKTAVRNFKFNTRELTTWNRTDINDKSTPLIKSQVLAELLFGNRSFFKYNKLTKWINKKAEQRFRTVTTFENEFFNKGWKGEFSPQMKDVIIALGKAYQQEEE